MLAMVHYIWNVRTVVCCGMNTLQKSPLPWIIFNLRPLFNNHSVFLRQQFAYQCVPSERDYRQKMDLLQIWWKETFYKWLIKKCIFSLPDMNVDAKLSLLSLLQFPDQPAFERFPKTLNGITVKWDIYPYQHIRPGKNIFTYRGL